LPTCSQCDQEYAYFANKLSWHTERLPLYTLQHASLFHLVQHFLVTFKHQLLVDMDVRDHNVSPLSVPFSGALVQFSHHQELLLTVYRSEDCSTSVEEREVITYLRIIKREMLARAPA